MHFDFTFTVGNIVTIGALVGAIIRVEYSIGRIGSFVQQFMMEHEMLIRDYCKRNNIELDELVTRYKGRTEP